MKKLKGSLTIGANNAIMENAKKIHKIISVEEFISKLNGFYTNKNMVIDRKAIEKIVKEIINNK